MLAPGRPGEPNRTVTAGPTTPGRPTAADVRFVQMMIPHHRQALEMAALAPAQARDATVKALADRIDKGQSGEISVMQSWLRRHRVDGRDGAGASRRPGGHSGHGPAAGTASPGAPAGHAGMPGMATPEQLARLRAAGGTDFDRLFLSLMITHHQGALTMARDALAHGTDVVVRDLAKEVLSTQNAEINRMRSIAAGLS